MPGTHIVLDKSYLRGVAAPRLLNLAQTRKLLLPQSLLIEVCKDTPALRASLFTKLPEQPKYCEYIRNIGYFLEREKAEGIPTRLPSSHLQPRDYSISQRLSVPDFVLPQELDENLSRQREFYEQTFLPAVLVEVKSAFDRLDQAQARSEYEKLLCGHINEPLLVDTLIQRSRSAGAALPGVERFDENWMTYRWHQVRHLHAIELRSRYASSEILKIGGANTQALHDLYDMEYVAIALLEGCLATKEKKLAAWMKSIRGEASTIAD